MDDLRKKKSKAMLKKALLELLDLKPYNRINIADIARQANLNRKTFYTNYDIVDDVLRDCLRDFFAEMQKPLSNHLLNSAIDPIPFLTAHAEFVTENRHMFELLMDNNLTDIAFSAWKDIMFPTPPTLPGTLQNPVEQELFSNYCIHGCWGNVLWIIRHPELSREELIEISIRMGRTYLDVTRPYYK